MPNAITPIAIPGRPAPAGHYSPAIAHQGVLYISGQLPGSGTDGSETADFAGQVERTMATLLKILDAAGAAPSDLLKVTAYIVGIDNWPTFNRVYAAMMGDTRPARAVVPVPALHHGYLIEIEAIAALNPTV